MQRRLGQVDLTTGEIHQDGFVALIVPKRRNGFQEGWVAMAQVQAFAKLAKREARKVLGEEGFGVLLGALSRLDYENLLVLNQAELARELEMSSPSVNRAIKRLVELSVLLEGPRIGVSRSYRLNPEFGWKGSAKGHVQA
ncbi:MAG: winged helix-turn-helix transcriptional regulator, partial [Rubrivivax sp.]